MADDKAAKPEGGGFFSGHDPFVLIIGALLAITLLANLFSGTSTKKLGTTTATSSKPAAVLAPTATNAVVPAAQSLAHACGLEIFSPQPFEVVTNSLFISGTSGNCDWKVVDGVSLYAEVIDNSGNILSDYTKINAQSNPFNSNNKQSFLQQLQLTATPKNKNGFLILVNPDQSRSVSQTVRIPIMFSVQ